MFGKFRGFRSVEKVKSCKKKQNPNIIAAPNGTPGELLLFHGKKAI